MYRNERCWYLLPKGEKYFTQKNAEAGFTVQQFLTHWFLG
jgi:hypothetical protein